MITENISSKEWEQVEKSFYLILKNYKYNITVVKNNNDLAQLLEEFYNAMRTSLLNPHLNIPSP